MYDAKVEEVARIEGQGSLRLVQENGELKVNFVIEEPPRFFEALLRGRRWESVPHMASRICGICSASHTITCLKALESALNVKPKEEVLLLRKLLQIGELIQSHVLHIYFLALPDFLQMDSSISLASSFPQEIESALKLKRLGNEIMNIVGGRSTHPISPAIGDFRRYPQSSELMRLRDELMEANRAVENTVELFKKISLPQFYRQTEFIALKSENEYCFYEGKLASSRGWECEPDQFKRRISEKAVENATAKFASTEEGSFMVGPLARINLNAHLLGARAKATIEILGLEVGCCNPFHQNLARVVELIHLIEEGIRVIELLSNRELIANKKEPEGFGRGVGLVEAPRGLLFYEVYVKENGLIDEVDIITPTVQNIANMEADINAYLTSLIAHDSTQEMLNKIEVLIRAYDPCLSCSTH